MNPQKFNWPNLFTVEDAYKIFKHIDPSHLDPETSYEYAQSFYVRKKYQGALKGFKRIPNGHPLYDLAGYYGAISALKLKKYQEAQDLIENAVVLPSKLIKSRNLYKKHIQDLLEAQQAKELKKQKLEEMKKIKEEAKLAEEKKKEDRALRDKLRKPETANSNDPIVASGHPGFLEKAKRVSAGMRTTDQTIEYQPTLSRRVENRSQFLAVLLKDVLKVSKSQKKFWGYHVNLEFENIVVSSPESVFGIGALDLVRERIYNGTPDDFKLVTGEFRVAGEWKLDQEFWFGANVSHGLSLVDGKSKNSQSVTGLSINIGRRGSDSDLMIGADFFRHSQESNLLLTQTSQFAEFKHRFLRKLMAHFRADFNQFDYNELLFAGPEWGYRLSGSVEASFPMGTVVGFRGFYDFLKNYNIYNVLNEADKPPIVIFDEESFVTMVYASVNPISWLLLSVEGGRWQRSLKNVEPTGTDTLSYIEKNRFGLMTHLSLKAAFELNF